MHEFGMVDESIAGLVARWNSLRGRPEQAIRVRYGPGLNEDSLRQAFQVHTAGTCLEGAQFVFIKKAIPLTCVCGTHLEVGEGTPDSPYAICPECLSVRTIPGFNLLEILDAY